MAKWNFTTRDNGGKYQYFKVTAPTKTEAINKGMMKAKKAAAGDIITWKCSLHSC